MSDLEAALRVAGLVSRLGGYVSGYRAYRRLKAFTRFHRIQLGRGLREALEWLELELAEAGPESLEVRLSEVSVSNLPETYPAPPEWWVADAWVEVGGERVGLEEGPTVAAAHSPESGGVVEGEGVHVRDPLDPRGYEAARGRVAVVPSGAPWGLAYLLAAEAGAVAVAFYRRDLHPDAVPYTGLFLPYDMLRRYGIPAVSLPRRLAERAASGARVRVFVDSDLARASRIPVLEASIPGGGGECGGAVAGTAHACHPAPGANDNGSGVVALAEAVVGLASAVEEGAVRLECDVQAFWAPEYTGFIPVALRSRRPVAAVNLDMVGVMPGGGEGPLHLYPPPLPLTGRARLAGLVLHALRAALEGRGVAWELSPFTAGSDHVPLLAGGSEASMVNQWPDTAYHSDRDDVDRISRVMLHAVSAAAAAALAAYPGDSWSATWLAEEYTRLLVARHIARGDAAAARLAASMGRVVAGLKPLSGAGGEEELPLPEWLRDSYPRLADFPLLSTIDLVPLDLDAALKLASIARGLGGYTVALAEPQLLADGSRSAAAIAAIVAAEHGSKAAEAAVKGLEVLAEAGLVKL